MIAINYDKIEGSASYAVNVPEQYPNKGFNRSNWYPTYDWNVDDGFHKFATCRISQQQSSASVCD
jgi:hypothetical protein